MISYWKDDTKVLRGIEPDEPDYGTYKQFIVGGGLTGMLTAYLCAAARGKDQSGPVVVLDKGKFADGHTAGSLGIVSCLPGMTCCEMVDKIGRIRAKKYIKLCRSAVTDYEKIVKSRELDCDFKRLPMYVYSMDKNNTLERECRLARMMGLQAECTRDTGLGFEVENAVVYPNQAQMNLIKFMSGINDDIYTYEDADVRFDGDMFLKTYINDDGDDECRIALNIIFATNDVPSCYRGTRYDVLERVRYAVMVVSGCRPLNAIYHCADKGRITMRSDGENLLLQAELEPSDENGDRAHEMLSEFCRLYYPEGRETHFGISEGYATHVGTPLIDKNDQNQNYFEIGTGRGGPVVSMIAAKMTTRATLGKWNSGQGIFRLNKIRRDNN